MTIETDEGRLSELLATHPAVEKAHVRTEGGATIAFLVPSPNEAPLLSRSCGLEDKLTPRLHLFEVGGNFPLVGVNKTEADFLYDEIVVRDGYLLESTLRLPDRPVVVDVGANIGAFAVAIGMRYPAARILAVEPIALLCEAIGFNAQLHGIDVTIANIAAADITRALDLHFFPSNTVMSGIPSEKSGAKETLRSFLREQNPAIDDDDLETLVEECLLPQIEHCQAARLTEILSDHGIEHVDLLKIDVEQAEVAALSGIDQGTWSQIDRVAVEVHDVDNRMESVSRLLEESGFSVTTIDSELQATGCWMVAGTKLSGAAAPSEPQSITGHIMKSRLIRDLSSLVSAAGEKMPDRFFVVSDPRLSAELSRPRPTSHVWREATAPSGARHR